MNRQTMIIVEQIDNGFIGTVSGGHQTLIGSGPSNVRRHYNSLAELAADAHNLISAGFKVADAELEMRLQAQRRAYSDVENGCADGAAMEAGIYSPARQRRHD